MSTRTNIVVLYGSSKIYLYRHHDGYLAGAGADLAEKLKAAGRSANKFVRSLIEERYDKASYETEAKPVYELTTEVHGGDIEYLYVVNFEEYRQSDSPLPKIGYATRRPGDPDLAIRNASLRDLAQFIEAVNGDIRAQNRRLAELRARQPAHYGNEPDQPEIAFA